jgi:putative transport protein
LKKDRLPQVAFALIVCASGPLTAYALGKVLGYDAGLAAGLLAAGYTNSGTLGVATANLHQLGLDPGHTAAMASLAAIASAVTYPFGTAGAAWFLASLGPKILGVDLPAACKELESEIGARSTEPGVGSAYQPVSARAYRVDNPELVGRTPQALRSLLGDATVTRQRQDGKVLAPDAGAVMHKGDTLIIAGSPQAVLMAEKTVGPEVDDAELMAYPTEQLDIVVTKKAAVNMTIGELESAELARYGRRIFLRRLTRAGHETEPRPDLKLQRQDVLTLLGARQDIEDVARVLGYADRTTSRSDIAFMAAGIVVGSLVGAVTIHVGGIPLSLSPSVGALLAGLVFGYLRSVYRTFGRIPDPALWVFNNVGLNGFIAVVGLNAAPGLVTGLETYGIGLFLAGIVVSMVPLAVGLYAGKDVFKFHPAILLGAVAGARTTTAALGAIQEAAKSTPPAIGYTIPYAVGRIVLAVCGIIIVLLMK